MALYHVSRLCYTTKGMNLKQLLVKLGDKNLVPDNLPDRSIGTGIDDYCLRHPYFERTVRHMASLFRYIPFSEVLDTMDYLVNNEFVDMMIGDIKEGYTYVFLTFDPEKSGHYFTLLFLQILSRSINPSLWDRILVTKTGMDIPNAKYVIVDDASYSGTQIVDFVTSVGEDDLVVNDHPKFIIVLVAASNEALSNISLNLSNVERLFIGSKYANAFKIPTSELYSDWEIIYETNAYRYALLGSLMGSATSNFYFQHKHPDTVSIPEILIKLPNPEHVDRILSLKEKKAIFEGTKLAFNRYYYMYINDLDEELSKPKLSNESIIACDVGNDECYTPFYKNPYYWEGIME